MSTEALPPRSYRINKTHAPIGCKYTYAIMITLHKRFVIRKFCMPTGGIARNFNKDGNILDSDTTSIKKKKKRTTYIILSKFSGNSTLGNLYRVTTKH